MSPDKTLRAVDMVTTLHDLRSRLASRMGLPTAGASKDLSLAELSRSSEAEAVFTTYAALLSRPPSQDEFRRHIAALRSKKFTLKEFVESIVRSPEGRTSGTNILFDVGENSELRNQTDVVQVFRVRDFFQGDVDEFLSRAYRALLNREADPSGMEGHRDAMRRGSTPEQVLAAMMESDEYRARGTHVIIEELSTPSDILKTLITSINSLHKLIIDIEYKIEKIK